MNSLFEIEIIFRKPNLCFLTNCTDFITWAVCIVNNCPDWLRHIENTRNIRPVGTRFWQISQPYLNNEVADYAHHITTASLPIFRPSDGPEYRDKNEINRYSITTQSPLICFVLTIFSWFIMAMRILEWAQAFLPLFYWDFFLLVI